MGKRNHLKEIKMEMKENKKKTAVYLILRFLVVAVMVIQIFHQNWNNVFMCILTLILFLIPTFVDKKMHIELPTALEIIILLFIFSAEILGEVQEYYLAFKHWDTMLHTMNGFLMAAIGFALIDIMNESDRFSIRLSPLYVALSAFCFSMTVGVLWEFFEYSMDQLFHMDMQKDTVLSSISSIMLNPAGINEAVTLHVNSVAVNGADLGLGGYLDVGLHDTMKDLFVNFIGAVVFSIIGIFYIKGRGKGKLAHQFMPKRKSREVIDAEKRIEEQRALERSQNRRDV